MSKVAISSGTAVKNTFSRAIELIGGIREFVSEESTIFIKPDLTLPLTQPVSIQPLILGNIIKACWDAGAADIIIGFNPLDGVSSHQVLQLLGLDFYIQEFRASILNLETADYTPIAIDNSIFFETLQVPNKLIDSDIFISLIAPRTDVFDQLALGLRNYYDLLNDLQKQELLRTGSSKGLLDFYMMYPPHLSIWDAFYVGEGQSPFNQRAQPYNLVLASDDLLAGDFIMSQLMGFELSQIETLRIAEKKKIRGFDPHHIQLIGDPLPPHCRKLIPAIFSPSPPSEWVEIIIGEHCAGCQIALQYFLDFILRFIEKDLREFGGISCLIGATDLPLSHHFKKGLILFGKCALSSQLPQKLKRQMRNKIPIFTIPGCPPLSLRSIESFCIDFKEWLPSLELVEQFIRKWTRGRQFPVFRDIVEPKDVHKE